MSADAEDPLVEEAAHRASVAFIITQESNISFLGENRGGEQAKQIIRRQTELVKTVSNSGDVVRVMADGPWQCNLPRLRRQGIPGIGDTFEKEKTGYGQITREEALWIILISLAFAKDRDGILANHDVVSYILHFFVLWTMLYSCILYAARFNDRDFFHSILWNCVMVCLIFVVGALGEGPVVMGWSACAVHAIIAVANARTALWLPGARVYCCWMAFQSIANAVLMACSTFVNCNGVAYQVLLWINVFLQPLMYTVYKGSIAISDYLYPDVGDGIGLGLSAHVPADFSYIFARWQQVHICATVGSFISSIALYCGQAMAISTSSRVVAACGFIFALCFKTSILDVDIESKTGPDSQRHPYRRNYLTSRIFLLLFPYSVLCIALTGMGFYVMTLDAAGLAPAVPNENTEAFARKLMSIAPAFLWAILTTNKALTEPRVPHIHWPKVVVLYILAIAFVVPAILEFSRAWSAIWVTAVQFFIFLSMLVSMFFEQAALLDKFEEEAMHKSHQPKKKPSEYGTWQFKEPKLLQEWAQFDTNTLIGAQTDAHELFSTVLLGVSLETMTSDMEAANTLSPEMGLCFITMYGSFVLMMRYSCRFSLKDMSHRVAWSGYQFLMLLQIVGMRSSFETLFALSSTLQFCWIAVAFWFRIAWHLPRGRAYAAYSIVICLVLAMISSVRCFTASRMIVWPVFTGVLLFSIFSEALFNISTWYLLSEKYRRKVLLPMNIEYLNNRMNGSFITIISVCMVKSGALEFWGTMNHPDLAAVCVVCIGFISMSAFAAHFHTDMVSAQRHAIRRGEVYGLFFLILHPCMLFIMALMGGMMFMLLCAVGEYGLQAYTRFARDGLCVASAVFKLLVAAYKSLHLPKKDDAGPKSDQLHKVRTCIRLSSCMLALLPLVVGAMGDFSTLIFTAATTTLFRFLHLVLNMYAKEQIVIHRKKRMRRNSSMPLI